MKKIFSLAAILIVFSLVLSSCADIGSNKVCAECNGELRVKCLDCNGLGTQPCKAENCDNGKTGTSCTNCGGREGIRECGTCELEGVIKVTCDICDGDKKVRNPITWEEFICENCDENGQVAVICTSCGGHGLICNYCRANLSTYPHPDYHPYFKECNECNGDGNIACDTCKNEKYFPCSVCAPDEYKKITDKIEGIKKEEKRRIFTEEVLYLLTGITENQMSYTAKPISKETLAKVKEMLLNYEEDFDLKTDLLKDIETIEKYFESKWEYVSGDAKYFEPRMSKNPDYYILGELKYSRDEKAFYFSMNPVRDGSEINGQVIYLSSDPTYVFEYRYGSKRITVKLTEENTLLFEEFIKGNPENSCELRRIEE